MVFKGRTVSETLRGVLTATEAPRRPKTRSDTQRALRGSTAISAVVVNMMLLEPWAEAPWEGVRADSSVILDAATAVAVPDGLAVVVRLRSDTPTGLLSTFEVSETSRARSAEPVIFPCPTGSRSATVIANWT